MTISSAELRNAFRISGSYINFTYNELINSPTQLTQSFFVSSSATAFYIRAIPSVERTNTATPSSTLSNIKFFLKPSLKELNSEQPLILLPRSGPSSPPIPAEIEVMMDASTLLDTINVNNETNLTKKFSYNIVFNLAAGQETVVTPTTPSISAFSLVALNKPDGCAPINMEATWEINTTNVDVSQFVLRIRETGVEFPCVNRTKIAINSAEQYTSPVTGQPLAPSLVTPSLTLQIVRTSDSTVVSSLPATSQTFVAAGPVC